MRLSPPVQKTSMLGAFVRATAKAALGNAFRLADAVARRRPVVVYYGWPDFAPKAEAVADLLRRRGFCVRVRSGVSFWTRAEIRYSRALHVGFWNVYTDYLPDLPATYVFFNAEPLSLPKWRDDPSWQAGMRGAVEVWGYAANHEKYVTPLGVPFRYVPFGYAPYYEALYQAHTAGRDVAPDIDVLFVGLVTGRREALLARVRAAGLRVHTVTYDNPLRGAALDAVYARSKIVLSTFATEDRDAQVVDLARLDRLLSNGRFVLHERPPEANRDLEFEAHVPTFPLGEIPDRCAHFARHDEERARIARDAQAWFKRCWPLDAWLPYDALRRFVT